MAGIQHQQRLGEIQHMSNICFVSLLPMVKEQKSLVEKSGYVCILEVDTDDSTETRSSRSSVPPHQIVSLLRP